MANMIPSNPVNPDPRSKEKEMFELFRDHLDDNFYVFHSYRLTTMVPGQGVNENEIDFLVFHPDYGCLFIECKNRTIKFEGNDWYFWNDNHKEWQWMPNPFDQAFSGYYNLFDKLKEKAEKGGKYEKYSKLLNGCKTMIAVWLPKYTKSELAGLRLGNNILEELVMTKEAMYKPEEFKKQIMLLMNMNKVHLVQSFETVIDQSGGYKHSLNHDEAMTLYYKMLLPEFNVIVKEDVKEQRKKLYIQLLEEQRVVLKFLAFQRTAAINGAGGTGKTLVAVERARLVSENGDRALFLCYNHNLAEFLKENNRDLTGVDFYTLDGFAVKKCGVPWDQVNLYDLKAVLEKEIEEETFEYRHIIVDEGQDFGKADGSEDIRTEILQLFDDYGAGSYGHEKTSFFIFYDANQMVNTKSSMKTIKKELPPYIQEVDSKLTLYRNCRNTQNIAKTAYSLLESLRDRKDIQNLLHDRAEIGDPVRFVFYAGEDEMLQRLNNLIDNLSKSGDASSRVLISCSDSLNQSELNNLAEKTDGGRNWIYKSNGKKTKLYTAATFKGLEADDVIIIDVGQKTFEPYNQDFYVAASRAVKRLHVFIDRKKVNLEKVLEERFQDSRPRSDKELQLAIAMHGEKS